MRGLSCDEHGSTSHRQTSGQACRSSASDKDLRGLMPYLRRYPSGIVIGLLTVVLMALSAMSFLSRPA